MDGLNANDGAKPTDAPAESPATPTATGTWAVRASLLAVASFAVLILLSLVADVNESENRDTLLRDLAHVVRLIIGIAFMVGGVGALGLSLRAIFGGARDSRIYIALAIGLVVTGFMVAEFTVLE